MSLDPDEPAVRVTLTSIYAELGGLKSEVAALVAQLGPHVILTKEKQAEYEKRLENHGDRLGSLEGRITRLEAAQRPRAPWYAVTGAIVGILTGAGALIALIGMLGRIAEITTP
ncbi:hypothetical protein D9V32_05580 [Mycetocola tolaasinivorans]|uniref:Uncharacterized protein n=1 Tax=Mycetocola tolaasinivorans TaxID=76635 RepID=A0A3L7A9R9_9MICO|nr:hypothetical protein [Mycetocola tolaasinivorans]RLP76341.1 hypothetical protein D9V32_05580 [Mycetocola tolaasinivorans]